MPEFKNCPHCSEEILITARKCKHCGEWIDKTQKKEPFVDDLIPAVIRETLSSKYQIECEIGKGGMATVYKAVQINLNRTVAIKVVHQNLVYDEEFLQRFHREAQLAASLTHNNIVHIYDEGSANNIHYMIMEYLEGKDLNSKIREKGKLSIEETIELIIPISEALNYAHENGIVHRDIKSANILVTKDGRSVLTDFGIAHLDTGTKLTQTGIIIGTPEYMSPEQAEGKEIDGRSDLYSIGVVLYECLSGKVPFKGESPLLTIYKILNEIHRPIREIESNVPEEMEELINSLLTKKIEDRISNGIELSNQLKRIKYKNVTLKQTFEKPLAKKEDIKKGKKEYTKKQPVEEHKLNDRIKYQLDKNKKIVIWSGSLILVIIILLCLFQYLRNPSNLVVVPNINGKTLAQANVLLRENSLQLRIDNYVNSPNMEDSIIVQQKPKENSFLKSGDTVDIVINIKQKLAGLKESGQTGEVRFSINPKDAIVFIDGKVAGSLNAKITEGSHTIKIIKENYDDYDENLYVKSGQQIEKKIILISSNENANKNNSELVNVKGGEFKMGSVNGDSDESPSHKVKLKSFMICKHECTVKEFQDFCAATNSKMPDPPRWGRNDNDPIVNVSWNDAISFCKWKSFGTGKKYRLPTEAEWEFAARGGLLTKNYIFSGSNTLSEVAWNKNNSGGKAHPVAEKKPNELGLFDMSGNVWEWCSDYYDSTFYSQNNYLNPSGPKNGTAKVIRGGGGQGSPRFNENNYRLTIRGFGKPNQKTEWIGFRYLRDE